MRVGYDGHLVLRETYGVGNCIRELARALARRDDVDLVLYAGDPGPWQEAFPGGASPRIEARPGLSRLRTTRILWQQLGLPRRAAIAGVDLFHAAGYVIPIAMRAPTVVTVYDTLVFAHPSFCKRATRWHYRALLPASVRKARRVLVPSRAVGRDVTERFGIPPERVRAVPPGIHDRFHAEPDAAELDRVRERYGLPRDYALFVGSREPKKNLPRLVEAFRDARRQGLDADLVLAGGAGFGAGLPEAPGVRALDRVPDGDLPALYRLARAFVFPSLAEGFGLPVLEAMACGAPVVASRVPAVEEADPEAVLGVDPESTKGLADALLRVFGDAALRRELAERGRAAAARFTWERAAEQTVAVYREALGVSS